MAFSIKLHPKDGCFIVHGSEILEQEYLPVDGFIWDDQLGYWQYPSKAGKMELCKYYALPKGFKIKWKKHYPARSAETLNI
jgi:hypothetical protein